LVSSVRALDADVVGIQEVDRRTARSGAVDQAAILAVGTGMDVMFAAAIDHDGGEYGVALGVRGSVVDSEVMRLPGSGEARVALVAQVDPVRCADTWTVACTHLSTDVAVAPEQLDTVLVALEAAAGSGPAALVGDLNMGPDQVQPILARRGWTEAPTGPTHPASRPRRRIDWIAVRGAVVGGAVVPALEVSDHRPVVAVVDVERVRSLP